MTRTNRRRALRLAALLALGTPLTADAAPENTGGAAVTSAFVASAPMAVTGGAVNLAENTGGAAAASAFVASAPMAVTAGAVNLAENTGDAAQATGNPLAVQQPVAPYLAGIGIAVPRAEVALTGTTPRPN